MKKAMLVLISAASLSLTACGGVDTAALTPSQTSLAALSNTDARAAVSAEDGWMLSADESAEAAAAWGGPGGKGLRGGHGGPGGKGGFGFPGLAFGGADLNLTEAQKTQLQALQAEARSFMEANRPTATQAPEDHAAAHAAAQAAINAAFVSDSFDVDALQASLASAKPVAPAAPSEAVLDFQADLLIRSYQILTAEQRTQIAERVAEHAAQEPATRPSPPADRGNPMLERLTTALSLSAEQQAELETAFAAAFAAREDKADHHAEAQARQTEILAILNQATPDKAALKALLQPPDRAQTAPSDPRLAQLAILHDVLSAEQRELFVSTQSEIGPGGRGHGGPGRMGGQPPRP
ncbi:MAG: Spy/CpxP family protein refolding chaperone [Candidatus Sericytochromatia bacterium]